MSFQTDPSAALAASPGPGDQLLPLDSRCSEFNSPVRLERLDYSVARRTRPDDVVELNGLRGVEVPRRSDGELLALFPDKWRAQAVERNQPELMLEPLVAGER